MATKLNKRLTIQTVARVSDGQGGFTETWSDGSTVWASIEPMKAYERFQAHQMAVPVSHKIVMRYSSTVDESVRLKYGTRIFNIKEVINVDEANRFLKIKAIETESETYQAPDIVFGQLDFSTATNSGLAAGVI